MSQKKKSLKNEFPCSFFFVSSPQKASPWKSFKTGLDFKQTLKIIKCLQIKFYANLKYFQKEYKSHCRWFLLQSHNSWPANCWSLHTDQDAEGSYLFLQMQSWNLWRRNKNLLPNVILIAWNQMPLLLITFIQLSLHLGESSLLQVRNCTWCTSSSKTFRTGHLSVISRCTRLSKELNYREKESK